MRLSGLFLLIALAGLLTGCATNPLRAPKEEWPQIGSEFAKTLRYGGVDAAAYFAAAAALPGLLAAFPEDGTLQLINVRHDPVGMAEAGLAKGVLAVEYIHSPSVSLKRVSLPIEWRCEDVGAMSPCRWRLATVLAPLP